MKKIKFICNISIIIFINFLLNGGFKIEKIDKICDYVSEKTKKIVVLEKAQDNGTVLKTSQNHECESEYKYIFGMHGTAVNIGQILYIN